MSIDQYDEFSYFHENLSEWNLDVALPHVQRFFVAVDGLRQLSGLKWGDSTPQLAMLHGGAQNAHTFDTVALAMQRPLVALDLPGHGHSDPSPYGSSSTVSHAIDVARALEQLLDGPRPLVGMSMGGLTAIMVAHARRDLVASLVLIDITPGVNAAKAQHVTNFINGPASFDDFDALLERTVAHNPIRHNALQRSDGTWVWRHQQHPSPQLVAPPVGDLWQMLEELTVPVTLLRGMAVGSVVDDEDEAELLRRCPQATIVHVEGAGHSIQGDTPVEMAALLNQFCVQ
jgi:pimeloyl-ACP methyl ester carboxylesterase